MIAIPPSAVSADGAQFTVKVPAHTAGIVAVTVTNPGSGNIGTGTSPISRS